MTSKQTRHIGYFVFDGIQALDLFGPLDAFDEVNALHTQLVPPYKNIIVSLSGDAVMTASGVSIAAHCSIDDCPPLDTLIIPGGAGSRPHLIPQTAIDWVTMQGRRGVRLGSVCTGLFILARTGLLDGKRVTTHWQHAKQMQSTFPALQIDIDALFVRTEKFFTAAGVTAGIDMALALIEEDHGSRLAAEVARQLVMYVKRAGGQKQYSSLLAHQTDSPDRFAELILWIADHLSEDLSPMMLAARVHLSERQFRRRFQQAFGETPTRFVERMRIEQARDWLTNCTHPIEKIARLAGFESADVFRRAFERHYGVAPSDYRSRFGGQAS